MPVESNIYPQDIASEFTHEEIVEIFSYFDTVDAFDILVDALEGLIPDLNNYMVDDKIEMKKKISSIINRLQTEPPEADNPEE